MSGFQASNIQAWALKIWFRHSSMFDTLLYLEELTNENLIAQCNFTTYVVKNYLNFWRKKCPKNLLLPKNLSSKTDRIFGTDTFLLIRGSKGKRNKPISGLISLLGKWRGGGTGSRDCRLPSYTLLQFRYLYICSLGTNPTIIKVCGFKYILVDSTNNASSTHHTT